MLQPRITKLETLPDYCLKLTYETGEIKEFDLKPYIKGGYYGELADESYFQSVRIIRNGAGIEWPNGQDMAPHELYGIYGI
jgi:hypothetical protein